MSNYQYTETVIVDFGQLGEQECECSFEYEPAQRQTWDEPGCDETIDIRSITWNGIQILPMLSAHEIESIEQTILESRQQDYDDYSDELFEVA